LLSRHFPFFFFSQGHFDKSLVRIPTDDVQVLEAELHDEIKQLRAQYREICSQVTFYSNTLLNLKP